MDGSVGPYCVLVISDAAKPRGSLCVATAVEAQTTGDVIRAEQGVLPGAALTGRNADTA